MGGAIFFGNLPHEAPPPFPHLRNKSPPLKSEVPFQEMIPRKNPKKLETVINPCVSIIKQQ